MSLIIFDFDGTIADSFEYVYAFICREAGKPAKPDEADTYRAMSMKDMAIAIGIPLWRLPLLYFRGRRQMREHLLNVHPFEGMVEVIQSLHEHGHKLAIVSSNSAGNVRRFLKHYSLDHCFDAVRGNAGFLGKVTPIKQLTRKFRSQDTWYVGDEVTDIASAKAAGVQCIAVTWGFASNERLREYDPTGLASRPQGIAELITHQR